VNNFADKMRNTIFLVIVLFTLTGKLHAQSLKEILTNGNWSLSRPFDSLHTSDTLVISQKPVVSHGWIQLGNDSVLRQRQTLHYCKKTKANAYAMMIDYKWNKIGVWNIRNDNLEVFFENKIFVLTISRISSYEVRFIVTRISTHP